MEFRRLKIEDLESCYACRLRALKSSPTSFYASYDEELELGNARLAETLGASGDDLPIFGALLDGKVVGIVGVSKYARQKLSHKSVIWGVWVDPEHRQQGVASRLIDLAIQHIREKLKSDVIYLSVASKNEAAKKLYRSKGFKTWGTEPKAMSIDGNFFEEDHLSLTF